MPNNNHLKNNNNNNNTPPPEYDFLFKLKLIGDQGVGNVQEEEEEVVTTIFQ